MLQELDREMVVEMVVEVAMPVVEMVMVIEVEVVLVEQPGTQFEQQSRSILLVIAISCNSQFYL